MQDSTFPSINTGFNNTFRPGHLSLGLVAPVEAYPHGAEATMLHQIERIQLAETLGFSAIWLRDVPFNVPSFGDAGQLYDPFVYLGLLAGQTQRISLGIASIVLPLRHPAHVAKASASIDALSKGRLLLGVASGDRPEEYPALNLPFEERGQRFRDSVHYIRHMWQDFPEVENTYGHLSGTIGMLPKPDSGRLPLLITGSSQQDTDWIARHGDGWMLYPRDITTQARIIDSWQQRLAHHKRPPQPVMQPLYIDITDRPDTPPQPIHLGFRLGMHFLRDYLKDLEAIGINHVALNLRFNQANIETTLHRLAEDLLPHFTH